MSKKGIKLSEKHGLNPSMGMCFWCGEESKEIVLCGRLKGYAKAPRKMFVGYDPCDKCTDNMSTGITLLEAVEHPNFGGQPSITKNGLFPTGRWAVLDEDMVQHVFEGKVAQELLKTRRAFVEEGVIDSFNNTQPGVRGEGKGQRE